MYKHGPPSLMVLFFKVNVFKGFNNHQTCPHQDLRNWSCLSWFCFLHAFNINCSRGKEKWDLFGFFCIFYLPPYFYLKRTREMRSHCFFLHFSRPTIFSNKYEKNIFWLLSFAALRFRRRWKIELWWVHKVPFCHFYRTRVLSLATLLTNLLTHSFTHLLIQLTH